MTLTTMAWVAAPGHFIEKNKAMSADLSAEIVFTGRLLLGGAFVFAGIRNIFNASLLTHLMSTRGVPWAQEVLWLGIVLQIAAGALLIAGI